MSQPSAVDLRYPTGRMPADQSIAPTRRAELIRTIAATPAALRAAVAGLTAAQLDTPYRPGGWTVRQVVHHVPDSHMHAYVRCKFALTEDAPSIKPYDEARWAELPDTRLVPVETSLQLLDALHARWVALLGALAPDDFARTLRHPEYERPLTLDRLLVMYGWHGPHHVAHVTALREREGW